MNIHEFAEAFACITDSGVYTKFEYVDYATYSTCSQYIPYYDFVVCINEDDSVLLEILENGTSVFCFEYSSIIQAYNDFTTNVEFKDGYFIHKLMDILV